MLHTSGALRGSSSISRGADVSPPLLPLYYKLTRSWNRTRGILPSRRREGLLSGARMDSPVYLLVPSFIIVQQGQLMCESARKCICDVYKALHSVSKVTHLSPEPRVVEIQPQVHDDFFFVSKLWGMRRRAIQQAENIKIIFRNAYKIIWHFSETLLKRFKNIISKR